MGRAVVLVAITLLHVIALMLLLASRVEAPEPEPQLAFVQFLLPAAPSSVPAVGASLARIQVRELHLPQIELPTTESVVTAITVLAKPPEGLPDAAEVPTLQQGVDYIRWPQLPYPPAAKRKRAQGIVYVLVLVGIDGRPLEARVHKGSGNDDLDKAARESVFTALFRPLIENGIAKRVYVIVPIQFSLSVPTG
jgi:periplasmic protein TonB